MRFPLPLALLASGVLCSLSPLNAGQEILNDVIAIEDHEKVPGENPAYFSRIPKAEQIFRIEELIMSPNPEHINANTSRLFTYLRGSIPGSLPQSLLDFATLTLRATVDGTTYEITERISKHSVFSVRREGAFGESRQYGGPLVEGENVLVGDMGIGHWGQGERVKVEVEAVARLGAGGGEGKVLLAVEGSVEVEI